MKNSIVGLRILIGTLLGSATVICSVFAMQSHLSVEIQTSEPTIETKYLKQNELAAELGPDTKARCNFKYVIESSFDYDIIEKVEENGKCLVRLKLSTVHARLSLPIEILYSPAPDEHTKAHEMGHAAICQRVYLNAPSAIKDAAKPILERIYTGQGANKNEACEEAIHIAANELCDQYILNTADVTQDIFDIYDFLELGDNTNPKESVEESFRRFAQGKTRRITLFHQNELLKAAPDSIATN